MKKTSSFIFMVVICASLALLTACEYDIVVPEKAPPVIVGDTISYSQDIQPIFTAKCIQCHPSVWKPDLTGANSYNALINGDYVISEDPDNSFLYVKCKPGGSMSTYCSAEQLALIRRWIIAGVKNN
jgi:hypothetical protein